MPVAPTGTLSTAVIAMTAFLKRLICRVLVGVLLSTQFAVAAYACPEVLGLPAAAQAQTAMELAPEPGDPMVHGKGALLASTSDAGKAPGTIDPMLPNLCLEHCQYGEQKADHTPAPSVAQALLTALYRLPDPEGFTRTPARPSGPTAPADPPHAILHCCLRT